MLPPMDQAEIEKVFRSLQLETEEQRVAMRFGPLLIEESVAVHVITTDSTYQPAIAAEHEVA